jgi:hypothetical protein
VQRARPIAAVVVVLGVGAALASGSFTFEEDRRPEVAVAPSVDPRACASFDTSGIRSEPIRSKGMLRFELGQRALAIATRGSNARVESLGPCATVIALERGRLIVHARELGGGELRVRTGTEEVVVRGTVFAVERKPGSVAVEVAEGRVDLMRREPISISAGERIRVRGASLEREPLPRKREQQMLVEVGLLAQRPEPIPTKVSKKRRVKRSEPEQEPAPEPQPEDLMQRAHEARKRGDLIAARELFSRAGTHLEAAWISLARMELDASRAGAAIDALEQRARRFGDGSLAIEAAWLRVRALDAKGDRTGARAAAREILDRWPRSPYAESARRRLEERR